MKIKHCKDSYSEYWYYLDKDNNEVHHRNDDLPAFIYSNGDKVWYQHKKLHRKTGAAIELCNGNSEYWFDGKYLGRSSEGYTKKQFEQYIKLLPFL